MFLRVGAIVNKHLTQFPNLSFILKCKGEVFLKNCNGNKLRKEKIINIHFKLEANNFFQEFELFPKDMNSY
jgi:hypothetical protein